MSGWQGVRLTLGCGHMELRSRPSIDRGEAARLRIGGTLPCYVCPQRRRRYRGGFVTALRQIVNVEDVQASRKPEPLDPVHWYWEGKGD